MNIKLQQPGRASLPADPTGGALRRIKVGLLLLVIGVAVTVVTYAHAASSPTGGTYVVAYGPVLSGFILTLRGLFGYRRARRWR